MQPEQIKRMAAEGRLTELADIGGTIAELDRNAALEWWSEPVLMSVEARRMFVAPDRAAPPFVLPTI